MMVYLIVFFSMAMVIGSWMWLMPSPQEKAVAKLRQNAILAGFQPKFINREAYQSLVGKAFYKQQQPDDWQIVRYGWLGEDKAIKKDRELFFVYDTDGQLLSPAVETIEPAFHELSIKLPDYFKGLLAFEFKEQNGKRQLNFYWQEAGDLSSVDFNHELFQGLKKGTFKN